jgi:GTP-binding protein Era
MTTENHRSGFVAVVGKPNVGKSTLVNELVGHKISIVTSKPHTTRHAILGVLTRPEYQIVFIDTPGLEKRRRTLMNRTMNRATLGALDGATLVMLVVQAGDWTAADANALKLCAEASLPCVVVVNKIDRVKPKDKLLPFLQKISTKHSFLEIVPVSALKNNNVDRLRDLLVDHLPVQEPLYPAEMLTDRGIRFQAAEILREKLMASLHQEVPYGLGVEINEIGEDERGLLRIDAIIWVDRESHKGIVVGNGGQSIKKVGVAARADLEERLERQLHLETRVKVKSNWSDNAQMLRQMGHDDGI